MSFSKSCSVGAVAGTTLGLAMGYVISTPANSVQTCAIFSGMGAVGGAIYGGTFALGRKISPLAAGSVIGGGAGALCGVPLCGVAASASQLFRGDTRDLMCIWGFCSSLPIIIGAIAGGISAKIGMITQRALMQNISNPEEIKALNPQQHIKDQ